ncbi:MAG: hypothetical protein WBJ45_08195 [Limnohabitans sp.]
MARTASIHLAKMRRRAVCCAWFGVLEYLGLLLFTLATFAGPLAGQSRPWLQPWLEQYSSQQFMREPL